MNYAEEERSDIGRRVYNREFTCSTTAAECLNKRKIKVSKETLETEMKNGYI